MSAHHQGWLDMDLTQGKISPQSFFFAFSFNFLDRLFAKCQTSYILVIYVRVVSFHVRLMLTWQSVITTFTFAPLPWIFAPCKSFSFHSIAAGHLTYLNYLKIHYLVSDLIYHCVDSIFCSVSRAVTPAIPRKPQIIALQIIEYNSLPKFINYWKEIWVLNGIKGFITQKTQS